MKRIVLMDDGHGRLQGHKTKQLRSKLAQDFAVAQESRLLIPGAEKDSTALEGTMHERAGGP